MMTGLWSLSCDEGSTSQVSWGARVGEHMDRSIAVSLSRVILVGCPLLRRTRLRESMVLAIITPLGSVLSHPHISW